MMEKRLIEIEYVHGASKNFFEKEISYKNNFSRTTTENTGWVTLEREKLNPERPVGDYKEAFNYSPAEGIENWPAEVPEFEVAIKNLFSSCSDLSLRLYDLMSVGLKLEDKTFLRNCHQKDGKIGNNMALRCLYYPPLPEGKGLQPGQIQCGEHSDYGTLTLLFQDSTGGLQIRDKNGDYIDAVPVKDTVVINIGDLMQRWTSDKLKATKHRVIIQEDAINRKVARQSIAFFVHPYDEIMVECLDGSNKYEPVNSKEYLWERFGLTYK